MIQSLSQYVISSDKMSVAVVPALGGRLVELTDLSAGRQWLWRNHSRPLGGVTAGSDYDEVWQGGFEELFPTDAPTDVTGVAYPDHGELWSIPWDVAEAKDGSLSLTVAGPVTGVRVTKTIAVRGNELTLQYRLDHSGDTPIPYLFKLHPALAVDDACRIELPGGIVEKVSQDFGNILDTTNPLAWPTAMNLDRCRNESSHTNEFIYVSKLPQGRCGITDLRAGSWICFDYPIEVFPYCWVFMTYGGWRGHNVVVLEPCTNYPKDLPTAISRGTSAILEPHAASEFEVRVSIGANHG